MNKFLKNRGSVALPIIIGSAILAVGILGGLVYKYKNNQSILSSIDKSSLLAQVSSNASVTATVTIQNIAVSLDQSSFDYGTMSVNSASSTIGLWGGAGIIATNGGNVVEDFGIYGADTVSSHWILDSSTTTPEHYVHQFCNQTNNPCATPPANYIALTTSAATLKSGVSPSATTTFQLRLITPVSTTYFTSESVPVTIQASAY